MSVEKLFTAENTKKIGELFTTFASAFGKQPVTMTDEEEPTFSMELHDGTPVITMSAGFIKGMGNHKLLVTGPFTNDRIYDGVSEIINPVAFTPSETDYKRLLEQGYVLFTKNDGGYTVQAQPETLSRFDTQISNLLKKGNIQVEHYNNLKNYFAQNNIQHHLIGNAWPETVSRPIESACNSSTCNASQPLVVTKYVVTEKIVEVQKVVLQEVPVYVKEVVKVPEYITKEVHVCDHTAGPITVSDTKEVKMKKVDEDADVDDKLSERPCSHNNIVTSNDGNHNIACGTCKMVFRLNGVDTDNARLIRGRMPQLKKLAAEEEEDIPVKKVSLKDASESSESVEETEESEEPSEESSAKETSQPIKLKGKFLNAAKTVLKSGEYVYRIVEKVGDNGKQRIFEVIGRYNPEKNDHKDPLTKKDVAKLVKMGHKIAKNCMP